MSLAFLQSALSPMALHGIRDGPHQALGIDPSFDQVILGPLADGLHGQGFIIRWGFF